MIYRFSLLLALLIVPAFVAAQTVVEPVPRVVMNLAAHPDDEDGLTMTYYRHAKNAVVHSVIYTRGEGGQNEIGPDLYARLGAIRTAETEAAARHLGTQVRFLNFDDFGYSKTASETFERWGGEDEVTGRLVYLIRKLKPDVLFTNHDTVTVAPRRQHGHHQAVGISAYRAMELAADPTYRPEQLNEEGVDLWQPQRLFIRLWRGGQDTADVRVPVGEHIPSVGRSAAEIGVEAVAEHRSQGFDLFAERFRRDASYFALLRQAPHAPPLPEGADDLAADLPPNPYAGRADLAHLIDTGRVAPLDEFAISVSDEIVVPGGSFEISWSGEGALRLSGAADTTLADSPAIVRIPGDASPTIPAERAQYDRFVNHPPVQAALLSETGEVLAAGHLPLEIVPHVSFEIADAIALPRAYQPRLLLRPGNNDVVLRGEVFASDMRDLEAEIRITEPGESEPFAVVVEPAQIEPGPLDVAFTLDLREDVEPRAYDVTVTARGVIGDEARPLEERLELRGHVLPEANLPEGLRVGFVRSYDDATEAALREMGAEVVPLDSIALAGRDLDDLHTIVVDIRAYLDRPDLRAHNQRLLDWVHDGGHLVVMYHKTFEWNVEHFEEDEIAPSGFAPYPLRLGRDRVTDHASPVTFLQPEHPVFNLPNTITLADFDGWIQERGLYFPSEYDERYVELLALSDPDEDPLASSTLIAEYGEGTYLYSALGLYRQLGAYVPGGYRLFANMVSLPLVDGRASVASD